ncbi:MAG TPA: aldo/keto reductase [Caldilineaceae bacterium]|nr:aldo/keto reductase [Caldilineaceae bacterium]
MRSKTLGRTGLAVSIVGLGTAFLGMPAVSGATASYEELAANIDEELGIQTVHAALEAGCTLIDTAALYGGGRSEAIIGRALAARPDLAAKCTVTTKVGRTIEGYDYSYDAVMRSIEASQRRLGLARLDVVYIHDQMHVPMEQVMGKGGALDALRRLQAEGVVRYVGTAADDPRTNAPYIETGEFDAAVVPRAWSLINLFAAERILPAAQKHNVGLVIATPLERGLLATGPLPDVSYFDRNYSPACQAHVGKLKALCEAHGVPLVAAALQWCTRHPQVATAIPGARFPAEAVENARAAEVEIPDQLWAELEPLLVHWPEAARF